MLEVVASNLATLLIKQGPSPSIVIIGFCVKPFPRIVNKAPPLET